MTKCEEFIKLGLSFDYQREYGRTATPFTGIINVIIS